MFFIHWNIVISCLHLLLKSITLKSRLPHFLEQSDAQHLCESVRPHMISPPKSPSYISTPLFPRNHCMMHKQKRMHRPVTPPPKKREQNKHNERKLGLGLCLHGNGCHGSQLKPKQCSLTLKVGEIRGQL